MANVPEALPSVIDPSESPLIYGVAPAIAITPEVDPKSGFDPVVPL
jgi:hypothetical protein